MHGKNIGAFSPAPPLPHSDYFTNLFDKNQNIMLKKFDQHFGTNENYFTSFLFIYGFEDLLSPESIFFSCFDNLNSLLIQ